MKIAAARPAFLPVLDALLSPSCSSLYGIEVATLEPEIAYAALSMHRQGLLLIRASCVPCKIFCGFWEITVLRM